MIKACDKAVMHSGTRLDGDAGYRDIAARLGREWVEQPWQAGLPLPRHEELERTFGMTRVTIQRAMNLLIAQGFIEGRRKAGRFPAGAATAPLSLRPGFPGAPRECVS